ncbi:hypothetical protein PIB30_088601 [Stylosanthes scabra]|uniref:Uncharacterized protein n=1 Tax=Stylosanthes scabra TaxID=79078 RepID=A0ABU6TTA0_9FABA|nr:hypothetical protein [Stylosanthes scabra]
MCRNSDIAELKATSSKSLIDKLKMFEINRQKLASHARIMGCKRCHPPTKRQICHFWELLKIREIKSTPTQQPESIESNHVSHGEPSTQGLNNSASVGRAANHGLKRRLDATPKWNNTVPATNALPSSVNSTQITRNIDQQNNTQVNCERVRETQDEFPLSSSEREVPQADEGILEQEGSRKGKSKAVLRASTIDEFLKENGIEMELEGLIQDGLGTEPQSDMGETLELDKDYSPHVMADIVVDEENTEKLVVRSVRDAWKRFKGKIKQKHFLPYDNVEEIRLMLYWSHPLIQKISEKNKEHSCQQKYPHRMGPINFARVRATLREANGANEEPKRFEVFIATRTNQKRKELDEATQHAIDVFESRQASGETEEEAFQSLFGKEQPGRSQLGDMQTQQQQQAEEIHGLRKMVKLLLLRSEPEMRPEEADALLHDAQHSPVDANSAHGSTRAPNMGVVSS